MVNLNKILVIWISLAALLGLLSALSIAFGKWHWLSLHFFLSQDLPVALALLVILTALFRMSRSVALKPETQRTNSTVVIWSLSVAVLLCTAIGSHLVFSGFPLSRDEFWAVEDGVIFANSIPAAPIPKEWQAYASALQPTFTRLINDATYWSSEYLPINAVLQRTFSPLASPVLAAASVLLLARVAKVIFPDEPRLGKIAGLLLASSPQFIVTAMTPYAMTAHLACNLLWLLCFLSPRLWTQLGAGVTAILAIGLHQAIFFPLFALPFLFETWLAGHRRAAVVHLLVIGAGFYAWSSYDTLLLAFLNTAASGQETVGAARLLMLLKTLVSQSSWADIGTMAQNLFRLMMWLNPMVLPLAICGVVAVLKTNGYTRALLLGVVSTVFLSIVVIPYQGHGWGYRYLHGLLGNMVLLAALFWLRMTKEMTSKTAQRAKVLLISVTALSALVLTPLRAFQAHLFARPYIEAHEAMLDWQAEVIVIDAPGYAFAADLARNDPFLTNSPLRMTRLLLTEEQLTTLCENYVVIRFSEEHASEFGLPGKVNRDAPDWPLDC